MNQQTFTLTNAIIVDPITNCEELGSLTVTDGHIDAVNGVSKGQEIDCEGMHLAPGIIDMGVKIHEPGERHKESFKSAGESAAAGGVTTIVARPDTDPPIDTPEILEFFQRRARVATKVRILPMAAITKNLKGTEISEMAFLAERGAIAFTDAFHQISDVKIFFQALQYASDLKALIIGHPQERSLSRNAAATSGKIATLLGLPSVSPLAEKLGVERDLAIVEALNSKYHADQITTAISLDCVRQAKEKGLQVTAGTSIHHIALNELDIANYRTFFKFSPPLRPEKDRLAIIEGIVNGEIDTISSFHSPQDEESKRLPFELAASGAVGLETILPACLRLVHHGYISLPKLFEHLSSNPAKILQISGGTVDKGQPADLILFDINQPFRMNRFKLLSKSKNTPFDESTMQGKVIATFIQGELIYKSGERFFT